LIVTVRLHANLRRQTAQGMVDRLAVELPEQATAGDLLAALQLDARPQAVVLLVNRRYAELSHPLHPTDDIRLFPPISGGN